MQRRAFIKTVAPLATVLPALLSGISVKAYNSLPFLGGWTGAGAEDNADSIASMVGAQAATSLSTLPDGHVEVLLGQQVIALPPGLETFGATTVTEQDFVTAAQQNMLPASEMPPASKTGTTAATQSVSSTEVGARAAAPVLPAAPAHLATPAHPASAPSAANVKRPADVPAGIPCVY